MKTALNLSSISKTAKLSECQWTICIVKAASAYTADKPLVDLSSSWSTGLAVKSWIAALFSSASSRQPVLCSWNSPPMQAGRIHLQSVTGSLSHTSNYVRSLHRFSTLSLLKRTAKALFLFSLTPTAAAVIDEQFRYSVVSSENLCWQCWFRCSTREQILLGGLHWITAMIVIWFSEFCFSSTKYHFHGCSSKRSFTALDLGRQERGQIIS